MMKLKNKFEIENDDKAVIATKVTLRKVHIYGWMRAEPSDAVSAMTYKIAALVVLCTLAFVSDSA
jgi:hypothetical protein